MKFFVAFSTILAVSLAEEAKVVAAPLAYGYPYAGLPYAGLPYTGLPYAGLPYAAAPAPVAAAAPAPVAAAAGFRTADSRLPVAPVYDGVAPTFNPEPLVA